jgi:hypothetical protein
VGNGNSDYYKIVGWMIGIAFTLVISVFGGIAWILSIYTPPGVIKEARYIQDINRIESRLLSVESLQMQILREIKK